MLNAVWSWCENIVYLNGKIYFFQILLCMFIQILFKDILMSDIRFCRFCKNLKTLEIFCWLIYSDKIEHYEIELLYWLFSQWLKVLNELACFSILFFQMCHQIEYNFYSSLCCNVSRFWDRVRAKYLKSWKDIRLVQESVLAKKIVKQFVWLLHSICFVFIFKKRLIGDESIIRGASLKHLSLICKFGSSDSE